MIRINSLIYDVTYPLNLGAVARTAHVFGGNGKLYFYDPRNILKTSFEETNRFSSHTLALKQFEIIGDAISFLKNYKNRKIATAFSPTASPLTKFTFKNNDLILFGNERVGLPDEVLNICDKSVIIPMMGEPYAKKDYHPGEPIKGVGEYPSFNIGISYGIVMYEALAQLGVFKKFQLQKLQ